MSQTQQNLLKAFAGESQSRNKYTIFAKIARKENWEWIAQIFEKTADNERVHAEELLELIKDTVATETSLEITPTKTTLENLKTAAGGEKQEWSNMYPEFEQQAKLDGDVEAERLFRELKEVEELHEERYNIIAKNLEANTLYNQETDVEWKCTNCGYIHVGKQAPDKCPLCKKPFHWYELIGLVK